MKYYALQRQSVALLALSFTGPALSLVLMIALLLGTQSPAFSHASLIETRPSQGAVLKVPPDLIIMRFNESIAPLAVSFVNAKGEILQALSIEPKEHELHIRPPPDLSRGTTLMNYRIVSADGHPVNGVLNFSIGSPSSQNPQIASGLSPVTATMIWFTRWFFLLALFIGLGGMTMRVWLWPETEQFHIEQRLNRWLPGLGFIACLLSIGLNGIDATGADLAALFTPAIWVEGWHLTSRLTFVLAALILILAFGLTFSWAHLLSAEWRRFLIVTFLALGSYSLTLSGHASTAMPDIVTRPALFIHVMGMAVWAGALPILYWLTNENETQLSLYLQRFSLIALPCVSFALLGGLVLAAIQLGQTANLFTTDYGRILLAKVIMVLVLLALAGWNRFILTAALHHTPKTAIIRLRRSLLAEIVLMGFVIALVGLWRFTPPPRTLEDVAKEPFRRHIHTSMAMVDLEIAPNRKGHLKVSLYFQKGDFTPLYPTSVKLYLSKPQIGIEPIEINADRLIEGNWETALFFLPQGGNWHIRVDALIDDFTKIILEDDIKIQN
jgi:copper transport protein